MQKGLGVGLLALIAVGLASWIGHSRAVVRAAEVPGTPQFAADGKLVRPAGYRKWAYLSSGYGMSYSQGNSDHLMFTNVFVTPSSYRSEERRVGKECVS